MRLIRPRHLAALTLLSSFAAAETTPPSLDYYLYRGTPLQNRIHQSMSGLYVTHNTLMTSFTANKIANGVEGSTIEPGERSFSEGFTRRSLSVGYAFQGWPIRSDVEYINGGRGIVYKANPIYHNNPLFPASIISRVTSRTLLWNFFYDFRADKRVQPFVGAGIGITHNKTRATSYDLTLGSPVTTKFTKGVTSRAWMIGAGLRLMPIKHLYLGVGIRRVSLGDLEWRAVNNHELKTGQFRAVEGMFSITFQA